MVESRLELLGIKPHDSKKLPQVSPPKPITMSLQILAYFFPVVFSIPLFGTYLAREWLWSFTPSLSYVGQGN
jgi:hypothetical protein